MSRFTPLAWLKLTTIGSDSERMHRNRYHLKVFNFETVELRNDWRGRQYIVTLRNNKPHSKVVDGKDLPAYVWEDGTQHWYVNGERHRDPIDGVGQPAYVGPSGSQNWYANGQRHRDPVNGVEQPAIVWADGSQSWLVNGKRMMR